MRVLVRLSIPLVLLWVSILSAEDEKAAFTQGELHQMLAPIALYPDSLLSQVLMAATYPLDIVEASRWSKDNPGREGAQAVEAVADKDWDPSVKALVAFPKLLARMDEDLEWTRRLGEAFLSQEAQVMETIQELREKAYAAGHLESLDHLRVYREGEEIAIEPASPQIVHVPYYHPSIYGGWWWPAYPPFYWGAPPGYYRSSLFFWGSGIRVAPGFFFSGFDWPRRHIVIVKVPKHRHGPDFKSARSDGFHKWRHDLRHRRGVVHREDALNRRFGRSGSSAVAGAQASGPQSGSHRGHDFSHFERTQDRPANAPARRDSAGSDTDRIRNRRHPGVRSSLDSAGSGRGAYRGESGNRGSGMRSSAPIGRMPARR